MGRYSHLSETEIFRALGDSHEAVAALRKYQAHLATGLGLPASEVARLELMISNAKMIDQIQGHIKELEAELSKRS